MHEALPRIKAKFSIFGSDLNLDIITTQMGIIPTKVRKKEEFPSVSIEMVIAKDTWEIEIEEINSYSITSICHKLIQSLNNEKISEIVDNYDCEVKIIILVHCHTTNTPSFSLDKEVIEFLYRIGAEIDFDIFMYE